MQHGDKFECPTYEVTDETTKHLAEFSVVGTAPDGITATKIEESFTGKGASSYMINSGLKLSGTLEAGETYVITVKYDIPLVRWFGSGWYRLPGSMTSIQQTFTIVAE